MNNIVYENGNSYPNGYPPNVPTSTYYTSTYPGNIYTQPPVYNQPIYTPPTNLPPIYTPPIYPSTTYIDPYTGITYYYPNAQNNIYQVPSTTTTYSYQITPITHPSQVPSTTTTTYSYQVPSSTIYKY